MRGGIHWICCTDQIAHHVVLVVCRGSGGMPAGGGEGCGRCVCGGVGGGGRRRGAGQAAKQVLERTQIITHDSEF